MCGICCHIATSSHVELNAPDLEILAHRGPDVLSVHKTVALAGDTRWCLTFASSVLSLRGDQVQAQPIIDDQTQSVLCWNGEAWSIDDSKVSGNDTIVVSKRLFNVIRDNDCVEADVATALSSIAGPYAFLLYDAKSSKIYFARDPLGRRSLLVRTDELTNNGLTVCSAYTHNESSQAKEVDTLSVHVIDLSRPILRIRALAPRTSLPSINRSLPTTITQGTPSHDAEQKVIEQLRVALTLRIEAIPTYTAYSNSETPSRVAVLFSGGLDCTLLARLADDILPANEPIDLLNVAFENPRVVNARTAERSKTSTVQDTDKDTEIFESCPDRKTGRASFAELLTVCPSRIWRFVAVNVPFTDFIKHRPIIIQLMKPHNTEMDLSITSALYFAARGQGSMTESSELLQSIKDYTTTARVLISGLGADELFGGYARHAAAFARNGYEALNSELELDFKRIGTRNLGRDDRVIAHWGRETRYPFLDENFVKFVLHLPAWEKCGFRLGKEIPKHFEATAIVENMSDLHPEKMLLRCAMWKLGMKGAAAEKKRAIQFGARTAKMYGGKTKGTDIVTAVDVIACGS